jgi:hypothetical protein
MLVQNKIEKVEIHMLKKFRTKADEVHSGTLLVGVYEPKHMGSLVITGLSRHNGRQAIRPSIINFSRLK